MNTNLLQSGLNLANYLQSAFPSEALKGVAETGESDRGPQPPHQPPALIRSIIDAGRFYFKLSHEDVMSNLLCLFIPVGKFHQVLPDLYIPVVSICTFLLLRSMYLVSNTDPRPYLGDVLGGTVTRICLVYIIEMIVLSGLFYITHAGVTRMDGLRQTSVSTDGSSRSRVASPFHGNEDRRSGYGGMDRNYGASSTPFMNSGTQGLFHNQVAPPFGNAVTLGNVNITQSQYGHYGFDTGLPMGTMDGHNNKGNMHGTGLGLTLDGKMNEGMGQKWHPGDNMITPLAGKQTITLPEKLFIMGYKYVLLNFYIIIASFLRIKAVLYTMGVYIAATSVMFSLRIMGGIKGQANQNANPILYVFPALQPVFCYILLPHM